MSQSGPGAGWRLGGLQTAGSYRILGEKGNMMSVITQSLCAALLTIAVATLPAEAKPNPNPERDLQAIISGERAWGQAFVTGDAAEVDRLLADDFVGVDTRGRRYNKVSVLNDVRMGPHLTSDEIGTVVVRFYGNTAIAQADEHEIGPVPEEKRLERVFTDTWVRMRGRWRIVAAEDLDPTR